MQRFFVRFAKTFEKFQIIELRALLNQKDENAEIINIGKSDLFCIVKVNSLDTIEYIIERAIFVKSVSFYGYLYLEDFLEYKNYTGEKVSVRLSVVTIDTYMEVEERNCILQENMKYIKDYSINLTKPDYVYQIFISNNDRYNTIHYKDSKRKQNLRFDIKDRPFIGITCMDWEISIFMANICGVNHTTLLLEPFIGSAGIALACILFDAQVIGLEYDIKMLYGQKERKGNVKTSIKGSKIQDNFIHIGKESNVISIINADSFKINLCNDFDAIITDPPYGDRISLGKRDPIEFMYCLKRLVDRNLKKNGRLCFFFPIEFDYEVKGIFADMKLELASKQKMRSVTRTLYLFIK